MKASTVWVIHVTDMQPILKEVENELGALQALVGGMLEKLTLPDGVDLWCNEDGIALGLPATAMVCGHVIRGDFFLARADDEGNIVSVNENDEANWGGALCAVH